MDGGRQKRREETVQGNSKAVGRRNERERQRRNSKRTRGESDTKVERESRAPPAKH